MLPTLIKYGTSEYKVLISLTGNNCHLHEDQLYFMLGKSIFNEGIDICLKNRWVIYIKNTGNYFLDPKYQLVNIPQQIISTPTLDDIMKQMRRKNK